jgi:hypothetical protein
MVDEAGYPGERINTAVIRFDASFWKSQLSRLGYPLKEERMDIPTLRKQRALPPNLSPESVTRLYANTLIEAVLIVVSPGDPFTRSMCTQTARRWKEIRRLTMLS